jgi:plastocyanin
VAVLGFIIGTGAACDRLADSPPAEIELEGGRVVQLPAGAEVLEVELTARGRDTTFQPAAVTARPGDVVRFRATEGGTHALEFVGDSVQPAQRDFLERTNQRRAPPLIEQGAAWIVSLEGAPVGVYPFRCITHGERGRLTVQAPAS